MKILFLVSSMNAGGAERVAATLTSAWADRGDAVTLLATYPHKSGSFYPLSSSVRFEWLADYYPTSGYRIVTTARKLDALRARIKAERPDVVVSFLTNVNVMALLATYRLDIPVIVCERTHPNLSTSSGWLLRALRRRLYPWADAVTAQTEASARALAAIVPATKSMRVIPNPLPPELLHATYALRQPDQHGRRRVVAMGRFTPEKQFDMLIRIFMRIAERFPDWDLVIWGDGPQREALLGHVDKAGMSTRIRLPGRTDRPWHDLARGSVFALTSAVEGFPNVLLEAMALGLACIAFDCPSGPAEMTHDGRDALLIPANDEYAFGIALERLLDDSALQDTLAVRAADSVRHNYALPVVLDQWDALLTWVSTQPDLART